MDEIRIIVDGHPPYSNVVVFFEHVSKILKYPLTELKAYVVVQLVAFVKLVATHINVVYVHDKPVACEVIAVTDSELIRAINFVTPQRRPVFLIILRKLSSVEMTVPVTLVVIC